MSRDGNSTPKVLTKDTKVSIGFAVLGVIVWYASQFVTDSQLIQLGLLIGIGLIAPLFVNQWWQ